MIRMTYDMAVDELLKAVRTRGEQYVYPEHWRTHELCQYVLEDGAPGCIVGQVFYQVVGAEISKLKGRTSGPRVAAEIVGIDLDVEAADLLGYAQEQQDKDMTWGYSASYAITTTKPEREKTTA